MHNEPTLTLDCYEDALAYEHEIVRRITARPHGGRLLLLDPRRLLRELGVLVSEQTFDQWNKASGGFFTCTGHEHAYDAVAASDPTASGTRIRVRGLFPVGVKGAAS